MEISVDSLSAEAAYKLLVGSVVPRPIAWITTESPHGHVNVAPFSAYTFLSPNPPLLGINIGRRNGELKDTSRHIHARREFVVNVADDTMLDALHMSADEVPPETSEVDLLGLKLADSRIVCTRRLADVPIAMECRLHSLYEFGDTRAEFIVGQVVMFHIRDGLCINGKIDTELLRPICRLGGQKYARLGAIVTLPEVRRTPQRAVGGS